VLAAIVLALMTCFWLIAGVSVLLSALLIHPPQTAQYPAIEAVQIVMGFVILLICGFCTYTVVGLFRIQRWARISILTIGGVLAFFSLTSAIMDAVLALSSLMEQGSARDVSPALMKAVFLGMSGVSLVFALVGVWWLVYFNLRRIRALFAERESRIQAEAVPAGWDPAANVPPVSVRPGRSVVETFVICLGVLYLAGAAVLILDAFLHVPLFLLGFILRGATSAVVLLACCVFNVWVGIGLLRRVRAAWVGAFVVNGLGLISLAGLLLPRVRAQMNAYQMEVMRSMLHGALPTVPPNTFMEGPILAISAIGGIAACCAVIWLLILARPLFERKAIPN